VDPERQAGAVLGATTFVRSSSHVDPLSSCVDPFDYSGGLGVLGSHGDVFFCFGTLHSRCSAAERRQGQTEQDEHPVFGDPGTGRPKLRYARSTTSAIDKCCEPAAHLCSVVSDHHGASQV